MPKKIWGIGPKILLLSSTLLIALILLEGLVVTSIHSSNITIADQQKVIKTLHAINQLKEDLAVLKYWSSDLALTQLGSSELEANQALDNFKKHLDELKDIDTTLMEYLGKAIDEFNYMAQTAVTSYSESNHIKGTNDLDKAKAIAQTIEKKINDFLVERNLDVNDIADKMSTELLNANDRLIHIQFLIALIFSLVGIVFAVLLQNSITKPIKKIVNLLSNSSVSTQRYSEDLTQSTQNMASAANEQAAAIQETISAMAEMSAMVAQTTEKAQKSHQLVVSMSNQTKNGGKAMDQMSSLIKNVDQAMEGINYAMTEFENLCNKQLLEIVHAIDEVLAKAEMIHDIVFKTQMLSFNASIEAARAGQHGRGFSVVATEIGNLAQSSGKAAESISALIDDSRKKVHLIIDANANQAKDSLNRVKHGKEISENAKQATIYARDIFGKIAEELQIIREQVEDVANASKEQNLGISQVAESMNQIDKATQDNIKSTDINSNMAKNLKEQSEKLRNVVNTMQIITYGSQMLKEKKKAIKKINFVDQMLQGEAALTAADVLPVDSEFLAATGIQSKFKEMVHRMRKDTPDADMPKSEVDPNDDSFNRPAV